MNLLLLLATLSLFPDPLYAEDLSVLLVEPTGLEAVFGQITVEADVQAPEAVEVELFVDGRSFGSLDTPPYRWQVDVGQNNQGHTFEVVATGASGVTDRSTIKTPAIKINEEVDVALQQLYVTVMRSNGERVLDLVQGDFDVVDDGKRQNIVTFARGDLPLTAVFLIDASESMKGERFRSALRGAEVFVRGMKDLDEASLVLFSDHILKSTSFTNNAEALLDPLEGVEPGGNTSINDHLYLALKRLERRQGRRVVVLFTDGADLHSVLDMADVVWTARRSQALIYWLRLGDGSADFSTAWRNFEGNRAQLEKLTRAVEESGGRINDLNGIDEIEPAFRDLLRELREQYVLGYYPTNDRDDGRWRDVDVDVDRSGTSIRARDGYVDF
ncbi:MAG: VWA domain-containing protein [Acidobacteriota bacterium]